MFNKMIEVMHSSDLATLNTHVTTYKDEDGKYFFFKIHCRGDEYVKWTIIENTVNYLVKSFPSLIIHDHEHYETVELTVDDDGVVVKTVPFKKEVNLIEELRSLNDEISYIFVLPRERFTKRKRGITENFEKVSFSFAFQDYYGLSKVLNPIINFNKKIIFGNNEYYLDRTKTYYSKNGRTDGMEYPIEMMIELVRGLNNNE